MTTNKVINLRIIGNLSLAILQYISVSVYWTMGTDLAFRRQLELKLAFLERI